MKMFWKTRSSGRLEPHWAAGFLPFSLLLMENYWSVQLEAVRFTLRMQGKQRRWSVQCLDAGWVISSILCRILFWDTSERLLAAAQLVYDINHLWSLLAIWLHVKDKKVSSQELDISCCTPGSVAPFGNAEHAIDVGGRTRGRLTVWLMEKKSSGRKRNNRMNVVFTEFEETWCIWTVAESPGEAQTDVFVWVLREEGRRGEAQVWFIRNQGLTVAVPSKNWHKHCSGITCHLPERSNPPTERHYIKSEQSAAGLIK